MKHGTAANNISKSHKTEKKHCKKTRIKYHTHLMLAQLCHVSPQLQPGALQVCFRLLLLQLLLRCLELPACIPAQRVPMFDAR
jgi:hypothetical protein